MPYILLLISIVKRMTIEDKLFILHINFKGTPGYKNMVIFIDCQWLVKTNFASFNFIGKLGYKFLPGQF